MVLSTMFRPVYQLGAKELLIQKIQGPLVRQFKLIPRTQYDTKPCKRLHMFYVLRNYWEIIPLFLVTSFAMGLVVLASVWSLKHKVDVQWLPPSSNNISHSMDLRHPTVHKFIIINQKYKPWPEMQDVLDKMKATENSIRNRAQTCSFVVATRPAAAGL